jgi:hypothetical protein
MIDATIINHLLIYNEKTDEILKLISFQEDTNPQDVINLEEDEDYFVLTHKVDINNCKIVNNELIIEERVKTETIDGPIDPEVKIKKWQ